MAAGLAGAFVTDRGPADLPAVAGLRTYTDAVAVVTGGASGIGKALALALARRGAVVVLADLQEEAVHDVAREIREGGGRAESFVVDVADADAMKDLIHTAFREHGRLDYLFNIAGIIYMGESRYYTIEDWQRLLAVNVGGAVNGVHAAYPLMIEQGFGHIVIMSSLNGLVPVLAAGYVTTKHALVGLALALRGEAGLYGVRVSAVCPGAIRTKMFLDVGVYCKTVGPDLSEQRRAALKRARTMGPEPFAEFCLKRIARNQAIVVAPRFPGLLLWWLYRQSPRLMLFLRQRVLRRLHKAATSAQAAGGDSPAPPADEDP